MSDELGAWTPLTPERLGEVLRDVTSPWWLAGGWALDAHLGRHTRPHGDTDVLVLRRDHVRVRTALAGWDAHAADPPGSLRPWSVGEVLPDAVHDVWVRPAVDAAWAFQLMIDDTYGDEWDYRRDARVRRPLASLTGAASTPGCPVLAPEVQLLYKSKGLRPKDRQDFAIVLPTLSREQVQWLREALALTDPEHPWLRELPPDARGAG